MVNGIVTASVEPSGFGQSGQERMGSEIVNKIFKIDHRRII